MTTSLGTNGSACISPQLISNKNNRFQYKVITQAVFGNVSWKELMQHYWNCEKEEATQLDTLLLNRYCNLRSFF